MRNGHKLSKIPNILRLQPLIPLCFYSPSPVSCVSTGCAKRSAKKKTPHFVPRTYSTSYEMFGDVTYDEVIVSRHKAAIQVVQLCQNPVLFRTGQDSPCTKYRIRHVKRLDRRVLLRVFHGPASGLLDSRCISTVHGSVNIMMCR